ncbi:MAG: Lipoprotein [Oscillospiraceae bacterium]
MKKVIGFLAAVLSMAAVLTACAARTPISADEFQKAAEDSGYEITQDSSYGSDVTSLVASKSDSDTKITFTVFSDSATASKEYISQKKSLAVTDGDNTIDSDAYNKYTAQSGEIYYTLIRMDNTLLFCKGTVAKKDEIDSFVKTIKY